MRVVTSDATILEVAMDAGFGSRSRFQMRLSGDSAAAAPRQCRSPQRL
jgi:transcriptional regulator GlxA family with amidase domain